MNRLIEANALKDDILKSAVMIDDRGIQTGYEIAIELIKRQPTVDAEPVRHGKWKWLSCTYDRVPREKEYECSKCHHKTIVHGDELPWEKYCPHCGARMDAE